MAALLDGWVQALRGQGVLPGRSFNLDFHAIPSFGADAFGEKHYLSQRSCRQPSVRAFLAQDGETQVLGYGNADLRQGEEADQVLAFVRFWTRQTGRPPPHRVFDSQCTTYRRLSELNGLGVRFLTLRRPTRALLREMAVQPRSAWRTVHLEALSSAVALNVSFDVLLTTMATGIYRLLARQLRGFERAQPRHWSVSSFGCVKIEASQESRALVERKTQNITRLSQGEFFSHRVPGVLAVRCFC